MKKGRNKIFQIFFSLILLISSITMISLISTISSRSKKRRNNDLLPEKLNWPQIKIFSYPNNSYHTSECLYPSDFPLRYVTEDGAWFQRMLEPTIHQQLLSSPILTYDPDEADLFYIPHYSRMCSGFQDPAERWNKIPEMLSDYDKYFKRYGYADHFIMHSAPNYGDKPADLAVFESKLPIIGLLDFRWYNMIKSPWTFAKSQILPFITFVSKTKIDSKRTISVFVAMSTSRMPKSSSNLRKDITKIMKNIKNSEKVNISRTSPKSLRSAIAKLEKKMGSSNFCIVPPGDAQTSKRLFDAISHLCVPIIVADKITLPYDGTLVDYSEISIQVPSDQIEKLPEIIENFDDNKLKEMREKLLRVREIFTWDYKKPAKPGQSFWNFACNLYYKSEMMKPYRNSEMTGYDNDEFDTFFVI